MSDQPYGQHFLISSGSPNYSAQIAALATAVDEQTAAYLAWAQALRASQRQTRRVYLTNVALLVTAVLIFLAVR